MKKVTCSALGGPIDCQFEIIGETAAAMGDSCKNHVMERVGAGDTAHQEAINAMMALSPEEQQKKFAMYMQICESALRN